MTSLLSERENAAAEEFRQTHRCVGWETRVLSLTATPTGIAHHVEVKCLACGATKDISDYDSW